MLIITKYNDAKTPPSFFPRLHPHNDFGLWVAPALKKTVLNVQVATEGELTWTQRGQRSRDRRRRHRRSE